MKSHVIAVILCLQTLIGCLGGTIAQYIYAFYLQTYPSTSNSTSNYTTTSTYRPLYFLKLINNEKTECSQSDISPDADAQAWAQQRSAELFFWTNLIGSCPMIIMTYILGLYTPQLGKRIVLLLPMIGTTIQVAIWLAIIYFHLAKFWWYIAAFIVGSSGSGSVLGLTLTLYITDYTIESERSSRFVRLGAMQTALSAIATFGIGHYIGWRGFTDLYWMAVSLQILAIIIVILFLKSTDNNLNERTPLLSSTTDALSEPSSTKCSQFFEVCTVFRFNRRSKKKTISLLLTLFSSFFYTLAATSFAPFLWFLFNTPFCWTSKDVGNYSALGAICSAILSLLGMKILTYAGATDAIICVIGHVFFCASCLWIAFARYSWQIYAGLLISAFSGYQGTLTTSMMSKWLQPHERSHAFTFITEVNTIIAAFGNSLFNWVYAQTVVNFRNLTFLIAVGLGVVPFILNICLFLITRSMSNEEVTPVSQIDTEPVLPQAGDAAWVVVPSRSLTSSLCITPIERSRMNSICVNETDDTTNNPVIL